MMRLFAHSKADSLRDMPETSGSRSPRQRTTRGAQCRTSGTTPHVSGTSLSAETRYVAGTREILDAV